MNTDERILNAISHTEVLRVPRQSLATFGITNIYYYLVTELTSGVNVVREGRVIAEQPRIVTPTYLIQLEGFSESARRFLEMMADERPHEAGIIYSYHHQPREMNVVSGPLLQAVANIQSQIEERADPLSAIIRGVEELWDVSLLKFTYELTRHSLRKNVAELSRSGLLEVDGVGVPRDARRHIEELFAMARNDTSYAPQLIAELNRWHVFDEYQDQFLALFRKK